MKQTERSICHCWLVQIPGRERAEGGGEGEGGGVAGVARRLPKFLPSSTTEGPKVTSSWRRSPLEVAPHARARKRRAPREGAVASVVEPPLWKGPGHARGPNDPRGPTPASKEVLLPLRFRDEGSRGGAWQRAPMHFRQLS